MFYWLFCLFWSLTSVQAEDLQEANAEIIVEAHKEIEVYVAPAILVNNAPDIFEVTVDDLSIFGLASVHSKMAKVPSTYGYVNADENVMVYNQETIEYIWPNCNYRLNHQKCSMQNDHWWLETKVTVQQSEIVITMYVYDQYAQIRGKGSVTSSYEISYLQRQRTTTTSSRDVVSVSGAGNQNCSGAACSSGGSFTGPVNTGSQTIVEDLPPTKIEVKPSLLQKHMHQASLRTWIGLKIE